MSSPEKSPNVAPLDLSKWRNLPTILIAVGGVGVLIGIAIGLVRHDDLKQFTFSWFLSFMFCLSLGLGAWFMVMMHHLFDASWTVPIRRFCEHMACFCGLPLLILFIPILILAPKLYEWMSMLNHPDHALAAKHPLFTMPGYYIAVGACFAIWWFWTSRMRGWSLRQDQTGSPECTHKMRVYAASGVVVFALTVTLASIMWIKGLMDEWYSTMFGVWYFAASVWTALATIHVIILVMQRTTPLRNLIKDKTYYMNGSLLFAFTVFYAYISFAQYFIIWNANIPEETFWYVIREHGWWWWFGQIIIFGHFFVPFLALLRIDVKLTPKYMIPICAWAWLMHFCDLEFQIMPSINGQGSVSAGILLDVCCLAFMVGVLAKVFIAAFNKYPPYPLQDPRMAEAMDVYVPPRSHISIAPDIAK